MENCSSKCDKDFVQKNGSGTALTQNLMKRKKKRSVGVIEKMAIAEIHVATGRLYSTAGLDLSITVFIIFIVVFFSNNIT